MLFKATTQKAIIFPPLLLGILLFVQGSQSKVVVFLALLTIIYSFLTLFIRYEFVIDKDTLTYKTYMFGFKVYQKMVKPKDINKIVFKRANWKTKLAIVRVEKAWNMRISLFNPTNVFNELETFANEFDIDIHKTSDYKILEKMT
ncbi:diguanylate cyclase [Paenibacillus sp. FSL H8-0548]|uniref:diguanylate cyclase n=1 Tax=Paenibacillus sp. FSL H8-0548 TaxID=1920422 RepID=UPI00096E22CE|nr:diguanylate cyclase [Paenibacillus sp. FSL H8-0548]OMF34684.1 diguanylate cyclase [Paenibacillus sp. FSL H8-0548]